MRSRSPSGTDGLLTIADIARHFALPESTARYYCKRFAEYIPAVGEGRRKRYRADTLSVIKTVLEAMQTMRTAQAVEELLVTRFPRNASVPQVQEPSMDLATTEPNLPALTSAAAFKIMEQQTRALENISHALTELVRRQEDLEQLTARARAAEEETVQLRKEMTQLRTFLDASEKVQQSDLDQLRTWLGRVVRRQARA